MFLPWNATRFSSRHPNFQQHPATRSWPGAVGSLGDGFKVLEAFRCVPTCSPVISPDSSSQFPSERHDPMSHLCINFQSFPDLEASSKYILSVFLDLREKTSCNALKVLLLKNNIIYYNIIQLSPTGLWWLVSCHFFRTPNYSPKGSSWSRCTSSKPSDFSGTVKLAKAWRGENR